MRRPRRVEDKKSRSIAAVVVLVVVVGTVLGTAAPTWAAGRLPGSDQTARTARPPRPAVAVAVVSAQAAQVIDGFGASGAWWPTDLSQFSAGARAELGRLLFSSSGLELSQYRYNIGGGGTGVRNRYKAPPAVAVSGASAERDDDPAGLYFLRMAASYRVGTLVGFVNSAPAAYTTNHQACGGQLDSGRVSEFAQYLADVVVHLAQVDHVSLSYVSPMNEPDAAQAGCRQEGMVVPVAERAELVNDLAADLVAAGRTTKVIADESSLESQLLSELPQWLPQAQGSIAVVAHHTYDYPGPAALERMRAIGPKHWATEICCWNGAGFGWQYDPTMRSGLWLADTIWGDLALGGDSAFDWWVAASPNLGCDPSRDADCPIEVNPGGRNDGLVYFDPLWRQHGQHADERFFLTKRYWVMAAFSRWIRPGAVRHEVSGLPDQVHALAAEERGRWVVELINDSDAWRRVRVVLPAEAVSQRSYVTDAGRDLGPTDRAGSKPHPVYLPPASVTTLIFDVPLRTSSHTRNRVRKP